MLIRIEVRVDGRIIRVEEEEIPDSNSAASKIWNLLYRAKEMLNKMSAADFKNAANP